ncbi:MAG: hypothetical protein OHK0045_05170 [Raineya sp.]
MPTFLVAQKIYTDYKPEYQEWRSNYIVDKIQYNETEIIFFFRYYSIANGTLVDFWFNEPKQYCLENVANPDETFYTTDIRNISVGGVVRCLSMAQENRTNFHTSAPLNVSITCEVHFPRIPNHIAYVNFLEGKAYRNFGNHFHAFNVKMKQWNDKKLGTPEERLERIALFENRNFINKNPTNTRVIGYGYVPNKNIQYNSESKIRM